jgi:hypothetical protein
MSRAVCVNFFLQFFQNAKYRPFLSLVNHCLYLFELELLGQLLSRYTAFGTGVYSVTQDAID